jgi:hypothetical protein
MRLAELSMPDDKRKRNWRKVTRITSVEFIPNGYAFTLPAHKADALFEGNRIVILQQNSADPLPAFLRYYNSRVQLLPMHSPLWLLSSGEIPTRNWFLSRLRTLFPDERIAGQSLRSGGATRLAEDGMPENLIQATGRWTSESFRIYIRKNPVLLNALLLARQQLGSPGPPGAS